MRDFFEKYDKNPFADLFWNVPETKKGTANIIGGNTQNFRTAISTGEFLAGNFPLSKVRVVLPETLRKKVPELPNFEFLPATDSGSFSGEKLSETMAKSDYNLLIGDLSNNRITGRAITENLAKVATPTLVTRDAVDLLATQNPDKVLENENLSFLLSAPQLQKLLRSIYYPRMMTLSQSLIQIAELLHKFTISYPVGIITLYSGQIIVAKAGKVAAVSLEKTDFSPITIWSGKLAAKIVALNLYNPGDFLKATVAAIFGK